MTFEKKKKFDRTKCTAVAQKLFALADREMAANGRLPVVEKGSKPWAAWREWRVRNNEPVGYWDRANSVTVPVLWPPADLDDVYTGPPKYSEQ